MPRYFPVALLLTLILLAGCDSGGDSGTSTEQRRYSVRYEATGTFSSACSFFYITRRADVGPDEENQGGASLQATAQLNWAHEFDVTVTSLHPFNLFVSAVCSDAEEKTVDVAIFVDDAEVSRKSLTGQTVSANTGITLTLDTD